MAWVLRSQCQPELIRATDTRHDVSPVDRHARPPRCGRVRRRRGGRLAHAGAPARRRALRDPRCGAFQLGHRARTRAPARRRLRPGHPPDVRADRPRHRPGRAGRRPAHAPRRPAPGGRGRDRARLLRARTHRTRDARAPDALLPRATAAGAPPRPAGDPARAAQRRRTAQGAA